MSISFKSLSVLEFSSYDLSDADSVVSASMATDFYLNAGTLTSSGSVELSVDQAQTNQLMSFWLNDSTFDYDVRNQTGSLYVNNAGDTAPVRVDTIFDGSDWKIFSFKKLSPAPVPYSGNWITLLEPNNIQDDGTSHCDEWVATEGTVSLPNATQVTSSARPVIDTSLFSGNRKCVLGDDGDYFDINDIASSMDGTAEWSAFFHIKTQTVTTLDQLMWVGRAALTQYVILDLDNPTPVIRCQYNDGTYSEANSGLSLSDNTEYVVAFVCDGSNMTFYVKPSGGSVSSAGPTTLNNTVPSSGWDTAQINRYDGGGGAQYGYWGYRRIGVLDFAATSDDVNSIFNVWLDK